VRHWALSIQEFVTAAGILAPSARSAIANKKCLTWGESFIFIRIRIWSRNYIKGRIRIQTKTFRLGHPAFQNFVYHSFSAGRVRWGLGQELDSDLDPNPDPELHRKSDPNLNKKSFRIRLTASQNFEFFPLCHDAYGEALAPMPFRGVYLPLEFSPQKC